METNEILNISIPNGGFKKGELQVFVSSTKNPKRKLDEKEKAKGRSSTYWVMDAREQWSEDKRLGILDWDGN